MKDDKNVEFISENEIQNCSLLIWYVTLNFREMTLFSNNSYLYMDENKIVKGVNYMKIWGYEEENNRFIIYYENKNNTLNIKGKNAIVSNSKKNDNSLFDFIDYYNFK